jgi:hypothetical protein
MSLLLHKKLGFFGIHFTLQHMYYPTQDAGKTTLHGLARSISPWKRGENFQFFTKEKVLNSHALKNKGGPAWDIFHGCTKELVIDTCLCFFHSHIINPRQILQFFLLTCSHY